MIILEYLLIILLLGFIAHSAIKTKIIYEQTRIENYEKIIDQDETWGELTSK